MGLLKAGILLREQKNRRTGKQKNRKTEEQKNRRTEKQKNRRTEEQKKFGRSFESCSDLQKLRTKKLGTKN